MLAGWPERKFVDVDNRADRKRSVQMREQRAAAGFLPFQRATELRGINNQQHQIGLAGAVLGNAAAKLLRPRKMDEAICLVLR